MKAFLFGLVFLFSSSLWAKPVNVETAQQVGRNFLVSHTNSLIFKDVAQLDLVYTEGGSAALFYVFNASDGRAGQGFVIVAADDIVLPILAYSDQSSFDPNNLPQNAQKWLEGYKIQIRDAVANEIEATAEISEDWARYKQANAAFSPKTISAVTALMTTRWNQSPYYNSLCPGGSVSGCVATAQTQIMKYWNYPANGTGFHSYNHSQYGTLSANFGSTTYNWGSMPNTVSSSNTAVATLTYHVGVSVDMNYSPQGSGAQVISAGTTRQCSEHSLKTYFGYKNTLRGVSRNAYSDAQWISLLKVELDARRPILYAGFGTGGGHAFVCDGYDNSNYFHFNWGWGGAYDGYFLVNALNPSGVGTGGGSGGYNNNQQAVIGIEPPTAVGQPYNLRLATFVTPSPTTINYLQSFSVTTNISNNGTGGFSGDYCAAVFDAQNNFVDYVETKTGYSLGAGNIYSNNLVFQTTGMTAMLPGVYTVGIFHRPTGGNWALVANNGSYNNFTTITVVNGNNIRLNSAMTVSPATLVQGQSANINLNILNNGSTTFSGQYQLNLYDLDGNFIETINTVNETNGLPAGYTYTSPFLSFNSTSIAAAPGSYMLAVIHKPTSSSTWQLTGSTTAFQNPMRVNVQAAPFGPDIYEANNSIAQSYTLPISFSNNSATVNTSGTNIHISSDNDFFRINLPAGYSYTISPRLQDSYNSNDGNTYSVDALFSYSIDGGSTWSETYDHVLPTTISRGNGGQVYFRIAPYFAGETGTYRFDINLSRSAAVGVSELAAENIRIYPNPASITANNAVNIDLGDYSGQVNLINIVNLQGQKVAQINAPNATDIIQIPLTGLATGAYFIQLETSAGQHSEKLIVAP
jgi:hypothetical protein